MRDGQPQQPRRRPGRPRRADADAAIHRATLEVIAEVGFDTATLDAIAERAGVGRATIYRRFQHKDRLVAAALASRAEAFQAPGSGDTRADLATLLQELAREPGGSPRLLAALATRAATTPELLEIFHESLAPRRRVLAAVLEEGMARGEVHPDLDVELFMNVAAGTVAWYSLVQPATGLSRELADRIVELLWQGAAPRPRPDEGE